MLRKLKLSTNTQFTAMALLVLMGSSSLLSASISATTSSSSYSSSSLGFVTRRIRKRDGSAVDRTQYSNKVQIFCAADLPSEEDQKNDKEIFDVSSNCIQPVFRSILPSHIQNEQSENTLKVLFLSEGNVCRSVIAEAMLTSLIRERNLQDVILCSSKGTRDYNAGESPRGSVLEVAEDLGLDIKHHIAKVFDCAKDVVEYDLLLVMDKFTASDALKDVTIFEAIDKDSYYSWKVRRLGDFCSHRKVEDIDDPLYGNIGGAEEMEELYRVSLDIQDSCNGLMTFLSEIHSNVKDPDNLKQAFAQKMGRMAPMEWVKPPLLQNS